MRLPSHETKFDLAYSLHPARYRDNAAWNKAEAASRKLETVGAEGWEHAKTSFEQASRELAETWHKIHPEDK
jgi:hypothetical protein